MQLSKSYLVKTCPKNKDNELLNKLMPEFVLYLTVAIFQIYQKVLKSNRPVFPFDVFERSIKRQ